MSGFLSKLLHRASKCPFAVSWKFLFLICCLGTLHVAIYHRVDMGPYMYPLLVVFIGLVRSLVLAFHWNCQLSTSGEND